MKTIAQQLNIKEFPFVIKDSCGKLVYYENSNGYWTKWEYDSNGNLVYFECSNGYWTKREYDSDGRLVYFECSNGYWTKREYDRPKQVELTLDEIADKFGINVSQLKIKK